MALDRPHRWRWGIAIVGGSCEYPIPERCRTDASDPRLVSIGSLYSHRECHDCRLSSTGNPFSYSCRQRDSYVATYSLPDPHADTTQSFSHRCAHALAA